MRILVIKPSSIGDVIHTFPAVALMRQYAHEVSSVTWVVNDSLADVVSLCPGVDRIVSFPRKSLNSLSAIKRFLKDLRSEEYDISIDYQGLLRSGIITKLSKAGLRFGFANAREGAPIFYDRKYTPRQQHSHAVIKNLELTRFAFSIPDDAPVPSLKLNLDDKDISSAEALLPLSDVPTIAVCFSSRWISKNWSPDFIAKAIEETNAKYTNVRFWLLGSPSDSKLGDSIVQSAPTSNIINLAGKTSLAVLASLLTRSNAMLTVDSGPMHLAAAIGIPCIAMFGSTDYVLTGPFGPEGLHSIIKTPCPDSPCMKHTCPRGINCCDGLHPSTVAEEIIRKLQLK